MRTRWPITLTLTMLAGAFAVGLYARVMRLADATCQRVREANLLHTLEALSVTHDDYLAAVDAAERVSRSSNMTRLEAIEAIIHLTRTGMVGPGQIIASDLYQLIFTKE